MSSETMRQILSDFEAQVRAAPCAIEFEMAYQIRVAIERIKFAIKHADEFGTPSESMRIASLQLLDALERLESIDRRFQARSRTSNGHGSGHRAHPI